MAFQKKPNTGALFKNTRKTNDSGPDYRGDLNVDGQEFWLAAWLKEGAKGKFFSLAITPKEGTVRAKEKDEDTIPF